MKASDSSTTSVRKPRRTIWQRGKRSLLSFLFIYLAVVVIVAALESFLMYPAPSPQNGDWKPQLDYEDIEIKTAQGNMIHGWYLEHEAAERTILLCHGNGEHMGYLGEQLDELRKIYRANVFAFDYRGYGKSPGKPTEPGIIADGEAAHDWLAARSGIQASEVYLWGRSLGGAVAVHLASKNGAKGLIVDRSFNSMVDVASNHYPWLPVRLLLSNRWPSEERIQCYSGPMISIHGKPDNVVPYRFGRKLFEACPGDEKEFVLSENLEHNDYWPLEIYRKVLEFMQICEDSESS
ncbi:MAG: alpha/beta hydrolase [Planctomycetota bacterium]|nr:alpha/beta hydrolase [Planctomycetota bacterium]